MARSVCLRLLIAVLALLPLAPARAGSSTTATLAAQPILRINLSPDAGGFETDGEYIVWTAQSAQRVGGRRVHTFEVYATPVGEYRPAVIRRVEHDNQQLAFSSPSIDRGVVVWREQSGFKQGKATIHGYDLAARRAFEVVQTGPQNLGPTIRGDHVVWLEQHEGGGELRARNIATMAPPIPLAQIPASHTLSGSPQIGAEHVVWQVVDRPGGEPDLDHRQIYAVPLGGGAPALLAEGVGIHNADVAGSTLAYVDGDAIVTVDLVSGARQRVPAVGKVGAPTGFLTTGGRYTFWAAAAEGGKWVWGYDQLTGSRFMASAQSSGFAQPRSKKNLLMLYQIDQNNDSRTLSVWKIGGLDPSAPVVDPEQIEQLYFSETHHTLAAPFRAFWETNGSLPVFGYPTTEPLLQRGVDTGQFHTAQYFERQRYEHHPEHAGTPYEVLLGRLGDETLKLMGRDWQTFPKGDPAAQHYFQPTGHAVAPEFWAYWSGHGLEFGDPGVSEREALALFGMPISEPAMETNSSGDTVLTQWFERARFEYHPDNPEPYRVLLGRLAADMVERSWPG